MITLLSRIETFTLDVAVTVSFTTNVCSPLSVMGNNNNQRVLQGDHIHTNSSSLENVFAVCWFV